MTAPESGTRPTERALRKAVDEQAPDLVERMQSAHPADVAELLEDEDEELSWVLFSQLTEDFRHEVLEYADDWLRTNLVKRMSPQEIARTAEDLPDDEMVDLSDALASISYILGGDLPSAGFDGQCTSDEEEGLDCEFSTGCF